MKAPENKAAFLAVSSALVSGPEGASFILLQFRQNAGHAELQPFTWRTLFR